MRRDAQTRVALCLLAVLTGALCAGCVGLTTRTHLTTTQQATPSATTAQPAPAQPAVSQPAPLTPTEEPKYVYAGVDQPMIYHYRQDCPAMKGTALEIEMAAARAQNMTPCPTCVPQGQ